MISVQCGKEALPLLNTVNSRKLSTVKNAPCFCSRTHYSGKKKHVLQNLGRRIKSKQIEFVESKSDKKASNCTTYYNQTEAPSSAIEEAERRATITASREGEKKKHGENCNQPQRQRQRRLCRRESGICSLEAN
ncbi:uncharacterized protein Dmoj_GI26371 [Drosophila mojavensis]|uniref:Uncharacterized protein n=1 Tax=Drosophila mojavensis TaxID=7230 RepID=A0A0Q9XEJ8_DROMO|nr:uncharacterized protein Dmoj_GI26371 [Drosophila mojavensis]